MTLQEVAIKLGRSEATIKNFSRTQKNLAKKGIILTKEGVGQNANYTIEYTKEYIKDAPELDNYENVKEIKGYPKVPLNTCQDLRGYRYGKLTPLYRTNPSSGYTYWLCKCDCGNYVSVLAGHLKSGKIISCKCNRIEKARQIKNDLTGKTFGRLTILELLPRTTNKPLQYKCQCECGNIKVITYNSLVQKHTQSCGCLQKEKISEVSLINLEGKKFGKLTVLKLLEERRVDPNGKKRTQYLCKCDCGNKKIILRESLISGGTQSCGCEKSRGESKITKILNANNIPFIREQSFEDCKDKRKLPFDFYIDNKYLIEYDGEQHFKENIHNNGWNTQERFELREKHDNIKTEWCKNNNIPLIRIPYTHYNDLCLEDLLLETSKFKVE